MNEEKVKAAFDAYMREKHCDDYTRMYSTETIDDMYCDFSNGFEAACNQSPWISIEERLPEHDNGQSLCEVLIRTSDGRCCVVANTDVEVMAKVGGTTHWMEIPKV